MFRRTLSVIFPAMMLSLGVPASAGSFLSIDATSLGAVSTGAAGHVFGINARGDIVGSYTTADGRIHGYLLSGGVFTSIDVPGAYFTLAEGINDEGQIVGVYNLVAGGPGHGYLLSGGTFTTIDVPGANATQPLGINPGGIVVGRYGKSGTTHGWVFDGTTFTTIDVPGASFTQAVGINPEGQIVGHYIKSGVGHGYLLSGGVLTTIDCPGALTSSPIATVPNGIDPKGQIVGLCITADGTNRGFRLGREGFTLIDVPGATLTSASGINPEGAIVGPYKTPDGNFHGYLLTK